MSLLLFVYFLNISHGQSTSWESHGKYNSRILPETQRYFENISPDISIQSKVIDVDWLQYPVITSNNDILVHGYNRTHGETTLYQFDQHLNLKSELILSSNGSHYHGSMAPIYHEYENNKYYIHYLNGKLLAIKIQNYEMNILWEFDHCYGNTRFQPLVYNGHVWFQHQYIQNATSLIRRYLFSISNGSVIWNKTDFENKYKTEFTPIIFGKYINQISVIYGNGPWNPWKNQLTAALCSFDFMTGDLNWCRNYSDYYSHFIYYPDLSYFSLWGTSAIYNEYDLLIQGGHFEEYYSDGGGYGFAHISVFNLSNTGELVSHTSLYDWSHSFVFNSRNGRNDLIGEFPGEDINFDKIGCPYVNGGYFLKRICVQVDDSVDQVTVRLVSDYDTWYPDKCEQWMGIKSPIDSYSSLISSVEATDSDCFDGLKVFVVTNEGRGNMICTPGDFPMIPNQNNHDDISSQLIYFVNHDGNRIIAHDNYKTTTTTTTTTTTSASTHSSSIICIIIVFLALSFVVC